MILQGSLEVWCFRRSPVRAFRWEINQQADFLENSGFLCLISSVFASASNCSYCLERRALCVERSPPSSVRTPVDWERRA
jgi:hypothetical protein